MSVSLKVQATGAPKMGRVMRNPSHSFQLRTRPWEIQPFLIAPVLPGETMKNMQLQSRVVSDPVKHPLIGWWQEYYIFYIKHRDLDLRDDYVAMMLDLDTVLTVDAANVPTYHAGGAHNWTLRCLNRIVDEYFRDEGEATLAGAITAGTPAASLNHESWLQSAMNDADFIPPNDVAVVDGADANTTLDASEVDAALRTWQFQRANGMTEQSYEDFLATYGIRPPTVEIHRPELVRYVRDWTYPSNTIDPTTGAPSSALSWSIAERADKDRFFKEPGFLFGVSVTRPKVYLSKQSAAAVTMLQDAMAWLPAILNDDPWTSWRKFAALEAPLSLNTDAYWVDIKDLFLYGDQFVNFALTETDAGMVALPTAGLQKRYADSTIADALFTSASPANKIRQDGIVRLGIASTIQETTP